jgi:hypothetical protein
VCRHFPPQTCVTKVNVTINQATRRGVVGAPYAAISLLIMIGVCSLTIPVLSIICMSRAERARELSEKLDTDAHQRRPTEREE